MAAPQGNPNATGYAAALNGGWEFILCVLVIVGAIGRLAHGTHGLPVLIASAHPSGDHVRWAAILRGEADEGRSEAAERCHRGAEGQGVVGREEHYDWSVRDHDGPDGLDEA
jgi:hypothetical protein